MLSKVTDGNTGALTFLFVCLFVLHFWVRHKIRLEIKMFCLNLRALGLVSVDNTHSSVLTQFLTVVQEAG